MNLNNLLRILPPQIPSQPPRQPRNSSHEGRTNRHSFSIIRPLLIRIQPHPNQRPQLSQKAQHDHSPGPPRSRRLIINRPSNYYSYGRKKSCGCGEDGHVAPCGGQLEGCGYSEEEVAGAGEEGVEDNVGAAAAVVV